MLTPTKLTSLTTPPGMLLPGASMSSPDLADEHLLGADPDPALLAVGAAHVRAVGRDRGERALHVDLHEVAVRPATVPSIRLDWPRKLATKVVCGLS